MMRCTVTLFITTAMLLLASAALSAADTTAIRVVLNETAQSQVVSGELSWNTSNGEYIGTTHSDVTVGLSGNEVSLHSGSKTHYAARLTATAGGGYVQYKGQSYRGKLELFPGRAGGVVVLNVLALEDYLLGVVPAEMPASWSTAALRAQAVAARTYALSRMMAQCDATFDVLATTSDQVYRGVDGEDPRTSAAITDTTGEILTYDGVPIIAYFSADAGGYTRAGNMPYLRAVPSPVGDSPHTGWSFELNATELGELAEAAGGSSNTVTGITTRHDNISGHLESVTIDTAVGSCTLSGAELRRYIGRGVMKSTRVEIAPLGNADITRSSVDATWGNADQPRSASPAPSDSYDTYEMQDYERPRVASGSGESGIKLRTMYAYDGRKLRQCKGVVHLYTGMSEGQSAETMPTATMETAPASITRITGQGTLNGLIITGNGYGHGRGLSQWGARQLAIDGMGYREILHHFYSGVEIVQWSGIVPPNVVQLDNEGSSGFYTPYRSGN